MQFTFSTTIEQVKCYIRTYGNRLIPREIVKDRPHKHFFMEFHCIFDGEEIIDLPEAHRQIRLLPGQILLIPRGVYHGVETKGGTVERLCFNFSAEPIQKENGCILDPFLEMSEVHLFEDVTAMGLAQQCRQLRMQENAPLSESRQGLLMMSIVLQLYSGLFGNQKDAAQDGDRATKQKWIIEEYIEQHFTDDLGIAGLSDTLYLSQRQTRTLVRRFLGEDYKNIIIRRRMELADIFLRDPERTLEEIAWQVG